MGSIAQDENMSDSKKQTGKPAEVVAEEVVPEISAAELMAMARAERVEAPTNRRSGKSITQHTWLAGKSCKVNEPPIDDPWYVAIAELSDAQNELATDNNSAYRQKFLDKVVPLITDTRKSVAIGYRTFIVRAEHLNEEGLKAQGVDKEFETFINTMRASIAAKDSTTQ